jgi:hypothetical protein
VIGPRRRRASERQQTMEARRVRAVFSLVAALLPAWSGCAAVYQPVTPMRSTCRNLPTVEECREAAEVITEPCLKNCVMSQCAGAKIQCDAKALKKCQELGRGREGPTGGFVTAGKQTCEQPRQEINWCELTLPRRCRAQAMVHELAHSCGWHHVDGQGVPGGKGHMECR